MSFAAVLNDIAYALGAASVAAIPVWGLFRLFSERLEARLGEWPAFWLRLVLVPVATLAVMAMLWELLGDFKFSRVAELFAMFAAVAFASSVVGHKEWDARHGKLRALSFRLLLAPVAAAGWMEFLEMLPLSNLWFLRFIGLGIFSISGSFLYLYERSPVAWVGVGGVMMWILWQSQRIVQQ